jgi:outer membrane protein
MNKGLLAFNIVLLVAVGVLYLLFFTRTNKVGETIIKRPAIDSAAAWEHTPVAYFEMDSIEANFSYFRKMQDEVLKKEQEKDDSIKRMRNVLQLQYQKFLEQQSKMTPEEIQKSQDYFNGENKRINDIERALNQEYQKNYMDMNTGVINKIKDYCKEFNKDGKYSYIIAKEPGLFFYTDTAYNITTELVKGLNQYYPKEKRN